MTLWAQTPYGAGHDSDALWARAGAERCGHARALTIAGVTVGFQNKITGRMEAMEKWFQALEEVGWLEKKESLSDDLFRELASRLVACNSPSLGLTLGRGSEAELEVYL